MKPNLILPILIYDWDCAFCSTTVRMLQRFMPRHPAIEPFQFVKTEDYGLTKQQCSEEIKYVDSSMQVHGGEAAFKQFFLNAGGVWRVLGRFLAVPIIRGSSGVVYRWVARNRHKLPGGTPTCSLPKKFEN